MEHWRWHRRRLDECRRQINVIRPWTVWRPTLNRSAARGFFRMMMRHDGRRRVGTYSDEYWLIYERKRCVENCLMWEGIGGHFVREVLKCNIDTVGSPLLSGLHDSSFICPIRCKLSFVLKLKKKSFLIACLPLLRVRNAIIRKGGLIEIIETN